MSTETIDPGALRQEPLRRLAPGSVFASRYRVDGTLGTGGWGVVYRAHDEESGTPVALKILRSDRVSANAERRFQREAKILHDIRHPNLVHVFDSGRAEDDVYLAMELVEGESLRDRLRRGRCGVEETIAIATQIAAALDALHRAGVVHRDVKPSNILLSPDGTARLSDLGLAHWTSGDESSMTASGGIVGTLEYLSPEQALGEELDGRSDLYSLGVVMYEMLTGELPRRGRSPIAIIAAHLADDSAHPDTPVTVPSWLSQLISSLLQRSIALRPRSAHVVSRALLNRRYRPGQLVRSRAYAVTAVLLIITALAAFRWYWLSRFHEFVVEPEHRVRALNGRGDVLWSLGPEEGYSAVEATIRGTRYIVTLGSSRRIVFREPQTGRPVHTVPPAPVPPVFPDHADTYVPTSLSAIDIDDDGSHEVFATLSHDPYYPSYAVAVDHRTWSGSVIFAASGHHRLNNAVDLDRDGIRELLFLGVFNRGGWNNGLAAVKIMPTDPLSPVTARAFGTTPDLALRGSIMSSVLWYALLPPNYLINRPVTIDEKARTITVELPAGARQTLTFDGFVAGSAGDPVARQQRRLETWKHLRLANEALKRRRTADAVAHAEAATSNAGYSGEALLVEWAQRVKAKALIADHQLDRAFTTLAAVEREHAGRDPANAANAMFDVASSLDEAGHLEAAADWYARGLQLSTTGGGRLAWEFAHGRFFALVRLGRLGEAAESIDEYERYYPGNPNDPAPYRWFLDWAQGRGTAAPLVEQTSIELFRYWRLEKRLGEGEDPAALIAAIDDEVRRGGQSIPMLLSLRAVLHSLEGRRATAAADVKAAEQMINGAGDTAPELTVHESLVRARCRILAAANFSRAAGQIAAAMHADPIGRSAHTGGQID